MKSKIFMVIVVSMLSNMHCMQEQQEDVIAISLDREVHSAIVRLNRKIRQAPQKEKEYSLVKCKLIQEYDLDGYFDNDLMQMQTMDEQAVDDNKEEAAVAIALWKEIKNNIAQEDTWLQGLFQDPQIERRRIQARKDSMVALFLLNHGLQKLYAKNQQCRKEMTYEDAFLSAPLCKESHERYLSYLEQKNKDQKSKEG